MIYSYLYIVAVAGAALRTVLTDSTGGDSAGPVRSYEADQPILSNKSPEEADVCIPNS